MNETKNNSLLKYGLMASQSVFTVTSAIVLRFFFRCLYISLAKPVAVHLFQFYLIAATAFAIRHD